jgi:aminodeoxyfutalosine synthase
MPFLKAQREASPIRDIVERIASGQRLTDADALRLFETADLHTLASLADGVRAAKHGNQVFYNRNRHIDYSNICTSNCSFCAFSRLPGKTEGAWDWTHEEIVQKAMDTCALGGVTEIHIVGGLHPSHPMEWYEEMLRLVKKAIPFVHIKAFTAVEIHAFSQRFSMAHEDVLKSLIAAGLDSMPGGGAEIFHPDVRKRTCPNKADADQWLSVHRTAHKLGLKTNATMLYGHVETYTHRVDHLRRLRELQDETDGFQAFVPLVFHPDHTALDSCAKPSGVEDLRTFAISRLYLDNIPHLKAYWVTLGVKLAQVALSFGVDDLDGTVMEETIHHMAGSNTPQTLGVDDLRRLILEVGRIPVERDSLYRPIAFNAAPGGNLS